MKYFVSNFIKEQFNLFLFLLLFVFIICFSNIQSAYSQTTFDLNKSNSNIIEFLRLSVSSEYKEAWLKAEHETWEPWLKEKKGFLGRQLLWDPQREEAILLITWTSRADWKSIPQDDIDSVQKRFEEIAIDSTGRNINNPFPIKSQGELLPQ